MKIFFKYFFLALTLLSTTVVVAAEDVYKNELTHLLTQNYKQLYFDIQNQQPGMVKIYGDQLAALSFIDVHLGYYRSKIPLYIVDQARINKLNKNDTEHLLHKLLTGEKYYRDDEKYVIRESIRALSNAVEQDLRNFNWKMDRYLKFKGIINYK